MIDVLAAVVDLTPAIRARATEIEQRRCLPADLARSLVTTCELIGRVLMGLPVDRAVPL